MSSGQSWMAIGAMVILSYLSLTFQRSQNVQVSSSITYESIISATGIGQSMLEQISGLDFDEKTIGGTVETPDTLTHPTSLGPEPGENDVSKFDDLDDYNGYSQLDTLSRLGSFECKVNVYYVEDSNLDLKSANKSFLKRVDISVVNNFLRQFDDEETAEWYAADTLYFSHIMSY
ncbi:hypothetical protein ACFLR4_00980 [Bacteroidota bacterium]